MKGFVERRLARKSFSAYGRQFGVTIIELMVGITIGILVVLTAVVTFGSTRVSSLLVNDVTRLEQQANMVMDVIGVQVKQAGAMNLTPSGGVDSGLVAFENLAGLNGTDINVRKVVVNGADGAAGAGGRSAPDTLTITYSNPNNGGVNQNCAGDAPLSFPITPAAGGVATPQVVSTIFLDSATGSLRCGVESSGSTQPLAENVEDFQVRYLVNDGVNVTSRTASQIAGGWVGISGVEICLHMTGTSRSAPAAPIFEDCQGRAITADGRLHRVVRNIFYLRNSSSI